MHPRSKNTPQIKYRSPASSSSRRSNDDVSSRAPLSISSNPSLNVGEDDDGVDSQTSRRGHYSTRDPVDDFTLSLEQRLQISSDSVSIDWDLLDGPREYPANDRKTGVQSNWHVFTVHGTSNSGSDDRRPGYNSQKKGESSHYIHVKETDGRTEARYKEFKKRDREYFKFGLVFEVLLVPISRDIGIAALTHITPGRREYTGNTRVRRFAVIRSTADGHNSFLALPIQTYFGYGVAYPEVVKSNHAIIHTSEPAPEPTRNEEPRRLADRTHEDPMLRPAIKVNPKHPGEALDRMARLNYGAPHGFDYGVKVRTFGWLDQGSWQPFDSHFRLVWRRRIPYATVFHGADDTHSDPPQMSLPPTNYPRSSVAGSRVAPHHRTDSGTSVTIDHANTPEQVFEALDQLRAVARQQGLRAPPQIDYARAKFLAENPAYRTAWIGTVRAEWNNVLLARRNQQNTETGNTDDDDGDDDEAEEEDDQDDDDDDEDDDGDDGPNKQPVRVRYRMQQKR